MATVVPCSRSVWASSIVPLATSWHGPGVSRAEASSLPPESIKMVKPLFAPGSQMVYSLHDGDQLGVVGLVPR